MVALQPQDSANPEMTTTDVNKNSQIHLIANRNLDGWATGKIAFADDT